MDTMLIDKDTYKTLKWVNQFVSKDITNQKLTVIHILGGSLVGASGFILGRVDIPNDIKEYCKDKTHFSILKLTTRPYLLIAKHNKSLTEESFGYLRKQFLEVIELTKDVTQPENFYARLDPKNVKLLATAPEGYPLDFYSKEPEHMTVALSKDVMSIIMPLHSDIKPKKEKENG